MCVCMYVSLCMFHVVAYPLRCCVHLSMPSHLFLYRCTLSRICVYAITYMYVCCRVALSCMCVCMYVALSCMHVKVKFQMPTGDTVIEELLLTQRSSVTF
jgi:hypothetical protein